MTYLFTLVCMIATGGLMYIGVKMRGALGGIIGFIAGAVLTGIIAGHAGIDLDRGGCENYSPQANDC